MLAKFTISVKTTLLLIFLSQSFIFSASNGVIKGTIIDAQAHEPLPYSNAVLLGTSFGTAADKDGKFAIKNVPPGTYTLHISYIGYKSHDQKITIKENQTIEQDFTLGAESVVSDTIVVTAQAEGQLKAINEQLSSIPIKNVVSAAKIQELPDANAAESVSRLPGVSLIRTGGEGSQVVIRGLSPQYNQVTIDGVEIPSDVASSNNLVSTDKGQQGGGGIRSGFGVGDLGAIGDRGTDLSMISSSMLGGIEVIKAITPDMDATLLGGVVNFGLRKASKNIANRALVGSSLPLIQIVTQGSYSALKKSSNQYKFVGSVEKRFLNEKFGVFIQGSTERRNLSANQLGASYQLNDKDHGDAGIPDLESLDLVDVFRIRERNNVTAVLDYEHSGGEIAFQNFLSTSDTKSTFRSESIVQTSNDIWYAAKDQHNQLNIISNLLSVKQDIPLFHIDLKLSHSYTESKNPKDLFFNFWQDISGLEGRGDLSKVTPSVLASYVIPNDTLADLDQIQSSSQFTKNRVFNGFLDFQSNITITNSLSAIIKFGGMYQYLDRSYDYSEYQGSQLYSGGGGVISAFTKAYPDLILDGGRLSFANFVNNSYSYGDFLNGDYNLAYPIDLNVMWKLLPIANATSTLEGYKKNTFASLLNNYSGQDKKSAAYVMATFNIGDKIVVLPGARYQNLTTSYEAFRGVSAPGTIGIKGKDTTITRSHGFLLPMLHLRYKPVDWIQLQFAYTHTLNYPDFSVITPRFYVGTGFISYNNYNLKPAKSENYDLVMAIYTNEVGLFTIDGFKKKIKDLIFPTQTYITDLTPYPDLPQNTKSLYQFNTYINNPNAIDVYGVETEWQTHFWYLPEPFAGVVFNINYTHVFSEASYPKTTLTNEYDEQGNLKQTVVDTFYTTRLLNQPNDILNLAIGYDHGGFSARISMLYINDIFKNPDFWLQNRVNSDKYTRFDLSVRQTLPWYGIQIYFNLNNITAEKDIDINQKTSFPAAEEHYGMTGDLGLRFKL